MHVFQTYVGIVLGLLFPIGISATVRPTSDFTMFNRLAIAVCRARHSKALWYQSMFIRHITRSLGLTLMATWLVGHAYSQPVNSWPVVATHRIAAFDHPVHATGARDGSGRLFVVELT